ncbi:CobW/HypB/UreG, nucleotide-binding domain-containing protein [Peziza echinospora]|nr:CobW/HypB/UreG, nucleotide-binding domain-containing protein [Peziza echinospora]
MDDDEEIPTLVPADASVEEATTKPLDDDDERKVPITIVTGYLGAGKSTLLNYILTEQHSKKIAFGDSVDIEKEITISGTGEGPQVEEWLEVGNGCICCSVKDNGVLAIEKLMERKGKFDYILLETTGLADPGNIAPLFWLDDGLGASIYLDGIVTLVDAANILKSLDEKLEGSEEGTPTTAHLQISHADVVVINKSDLVTAEQLQEVKERVQGINGLARVVVTERGVIGNDKFDWLLDLDAYRKVDIPSFSVGSGGRSKIDPTVSTIAIPIHTRLDEGQMQLLDAWLRSLLWEELVPGVNGEDARPVDIHRLKGRVAREDGQTTLIQGVREVFEMFDGKERGIGADVEVTSCKIVLIGRKLQEKNIQESLNWFVLGRNGTTTL